MIEVRVSAPVADTLAACLDRGLEVRSAREMAGKPGSHHYHLAYPERSGTLELSEHRGEVWFSINERRDCGWVTSFAHEVAAALAEIGQSLEKS